jgi:1,4-alpha-glucan branching enzyme
MLQKKYVKSKDEYEVTFAYDANGAKHVELVCEANGWEPLAMKRNKQGAFQTKVRLPKDSRYQFRYRVDESKWVNDEAADAYAPNEHGSINSVVETFAA